MQNNILEQYKLLRLKKIELESEIKIIEQDAIAEAIEILGNGNSINGKRIVSQDSLGEVTIQFRTTLPKDSDHQDLEYLAEAIAIEQEKAKRVNKDAIASLEKQLLNIQNSISFLSNTDEGRQYEKEYLGLRASLTEQKPVLVFKLGR